MTRYIFVRHGQSTANADRTLAGWSDVSLTPDGMRQAHDTAGQIKRSGLLFDKIISSPLSRALDTATIIAQANNYPVENIVIIDELKERSGGSLELGPLRDLFRKSEQQRIEAGGESARQFHTRVEKANERIRQVTADCTVVLVVAHSGVYKMALTIHQGEPDPTAVYDMATPRNAVLLEYPIK